MEKDFHNLTVSQINEFIDILYTCMDDYLYVYDFTHDFYRISPHALKRFALPAESFHNVIMNHEKFVYPDDLEELQVEINDIIAGKRNFHNMQYRWMSHQGEPIWINCRGYIAKSGNTPIYMVGCINEIGKRQKADNVSGLLGISSLQAFLNDRRLHMRKGYLLRLGLDEFKEINERLGSDYGDMVLRQTAECIKACKLPGQEIYRAMADEFLVVDFQGNDLQTAVEQYRQIRHTVDRFVEDNHYEAVFTISGGILACDNLEGMSFFDMMKLSEFSLNEAKKKGKNLFYIFNQEDYDRFVRTREITKLLRRSVNNNFEGFEVYLQPLYNAETESLYGAEALMRFHSEEYGMISPAEFVPILEETGLIMPAGKWILHEALVLGHKIQKLQPDFRISINISYIQVMKSNIISEIISAVMEHEVLPSTVIIELTESGLLDSDTRVAKLWAKLKEKGIHLALDDFGTGSSNFQYLNELKPDLIKIDRSFTVKALENEYEYNLLSLMSDMVHGLNLKMCVEGIETVDELSRMKELSPDYCQGYYFGKPCTFEKFKEDFLVS